MADYWFMEKAKRGAQYGYPAVADADNNIYTNSYFSKGSVGFYEGYTSKYSPKGHLIWERQLTQMTNNTNGSIFRDIAIDSNGDLISLGYAYDGISYDMIVVKQDSDGNKIWAKSAYNAYHDIVLALALDSSDNIYITGYSRNLGDTNDYRIPIIKFNSSGTVQWIRRITDTGTSYDTYGYGLTTDSSDNVIVSGYLNRPVGSNTALKTVLAKYNSSGTLQWSAGFEDSSQNVQGRMVATDSSDNVYVVGNGAYSSNPVGYIAKYNSSGTLQWQKALITASPDYAQLVLYAIAIDSNDNLYVGGSKQIDSNTTNASYLAKIDIDGSSIDWDYTFSFASSTRQFGNIQKINFDANNDLLVCCGGVDTSDRNTIETLIKFPASGVISTGTFGSNAEGGYEIAVPTDTSIVTGTMSTYTASSYFSESDGSPYYTHADLSYDNYDMVEKTSIA